MNIAFVNNILKSHIRACKDQKDSLRSDELESHAYFDGAIEALEHARETIKTFIKTANTLTEKQ